MNVAFQSISVQPHHLKLNVCGSRAKYRDGRKDRAVKVYTVNQESIYILIVGVPAVGAADELQALCDQYGIVEDFRPVDDYPTEEFTEVYLVKYSSFSAARNSKKHLDDKSFFGGVLHVFYAPEFETVNETRLKLQDRRKFVAWKTNTGKKTNVTDSQVVKPSQPLTNVAHEQPETYIWAGKEYPVNPVVVSSAVTEPVSTQPKSNLFVPRQLKSTVPSAFSSNPGNSQMSTQNKNVNSSYENTISNIRKRVSKVSVPNMRMSLKRKRRL